MNYNEVHDFMETNKSKGFFWDQYTVVKWSPGQKGYMQTNGMYKNNKWGYSHRYNVTSKGTWEISDKYEKLI